MTAKQIAAARAELRETLDALNAEIDHLHLVEERVAILESRAHCAVDEIFAAQDVLTTREARNES